jgi:hypothetical protein
MSYEEALRSAVAGRVDYQVIDVFQREHDVAHHSGPLFRRVQTKHNLGSALLNMANSATNPADYVRMYQESEELLLAAIKLQPLYKAAIQNLDMVRQNRMKRPGFESVTTQTVQNSALHMQHALPFRAYYRLEMKTDSSNGDGVTGTGGDAAIKFETEEEVSSAHYTSPGESMVVKKDTQTDFLSSTMDQFSTRF